MAFFLLVIDVNFFVLREVGLWFVFFLRRVAFGVVNGSGVCDRIGVYGIRGHDRPNPHPPEGNNSLGE